MGLFGGAKHFKGNMRDYQKLDDYSYWGPSYELVVEAQKSAIHALNSWNAFLDETGTIHAEFGGPNSKGAQLLSNFLNRQDLAFNAYELWRRRFPHTDNIGNPRFGMCNQAAILVNACMNVMPGAKALVIKTRINALWSSDVEDSQNVFNSVNEALTGIAEARSGTSNFSGYSRTVRYREGFSIAAETAKSVTHFRLLFDSVMPAVTEILLWLAGKDDGLQK